MKQSKNRHTKRFTGFSFRMMMLVCGAHLLQGVTTCSAQPQQVHSDGGGASSYLTTSAERLGISYQVVDSTVWLDGFQIPPATPLGSVGNAFWSYHPYGLFRFDSLWDGDGIHYRSGSCFVLEQELSEFLRKDLRPSTTVSGLMTLVGMMRARESSDPQDYFGRDAQFVHYESAICFRSGETRVKQSKEVLIFYDSEHYLREVRQDDFILPSDASPHIRITVTTEADPSGKTVAADTSNEGSPDHNADLLPSRFVAHALVTPIRDPRLLSDCLVWNIKMEPGDSLVLPCELEGAGQLRLRRLDLDQRHAIYLGSPNTPVICGFSK